MKEEKALKAVALLRGLLDPVHGRVDLKGQLRFQFEGDQNS